MIYLDANASERPRPEARAALLAAAELAGNPASIHAAGRAARRVLESARETLAAGLGAASSGAVFTSGGTESNALAIAALGAGRRLIAGATEHDAVRAAALTAGGGDVLPVDEAGRADLAALEHLLARGEPSLVCLMLANNETGTIQDVAAAAALCRRAGARLHVDAVQAVGRMTVDLAALGADSLALSGHKFGGPPGAGALLLAGEAALAPLIAGGGQERGRRGGTPALPAIAGMAAAMEAALAALADPARPGHPAALAALRDRVEDAARAAGAVICGAGAARLPNTTSLALPGVPAERQVIALDLEGFAVSAGAACSSGKVTRSHVLEAMGLGELAGQAIRVSLPWSATVAEVEAFIAAYTRMAARLGRGAA